MNRHIIKTILFPILLLSLTGISKGQQNTGINTAIAEKFRRYCKAVPREEVFIHTDRDEYIAGENIWFGIYLFDRQNTELSDGNDVIYMELLNPENLPVVRKRFRIEKGIGPGLMVIPDTLSTGIYLLRAYSAWMKNFLPANCFMKEIRIYNSLNPKRVTGIAGTGTIMENRPVVQDSVLLSDRGFILNIDNSRPGAVRVTVNTDESFRKLNSNLLYVFVQTHGIINYNEPLRLTGSATILDLPESILIPGISQLVLFSFGGVLLDEAYFYTPVKETPQISMISPDTFKKRSKIQLEIDPVNISGINTDRMHLSFSVASGPAGEKKADITDYMIFGSEFGTIPEAIRDKKLNQVPLQTIKDFLATAKSNWIDWKAILSGNYPELKYRMEKEYHSLSGHLLRPDNLDPDTGQYVFLSHPGRTAYFQYAKTDSEGKFSFIIPAALSEKDIIIQPAMPERGDIIKIGSSYSDAYFPPVKQSTRIEGKEPSYIAQWSANYQIDKIYGISCTGDTIKTDKAVSKPLRFYGKPDLEIIMKDYIKLPVMQEVFFELIPGVFLKEKKSVWEITMADPITRIIYSMPPMLLVDGVVIHDASVIANLDPELVEKIDVVMSQYIVGDYLISGIVNVITKKADLSNITLPDYAVHIYFSTADPVLYFSSPDYTTEALQDGHIPDFRNTLYWNPSLRQDSNGKFRPEFYSSDMESAYTIDIQGVDEDGRPVSLRKVIDIK